MQGTRTRLQLDYQLTFHTPFHFGTGLAEGIVDRSVQRDAAGYIYVPGSTLKGVVREHCEQLARFFNPGDQRTTSPHDTANALQDLYSETTLITHIFGSQHHPGLLFFDNAYQTDEELELYNGANGDDNHDNYKDLQTSIYTQVRLERLTRTAVPGALYTSEFGNKDFLFEGTLSGWLADCTPIGQIPDLSQELLLLLAGLLLVDRLGGNKSAGKGACTLDIVHLTVNGQAKDRTAWESWLDALDVLGKESY
jgi:Uncharacterized protein predicted to be involved in DNA repair (RAMP superfamily)